MLVQWLYNLPLWVLYVGVTLISVALSMGVVLLIRRRGWMLELSDAASAASIHAFIAVVYAVALALIVVDIQQEYHQVQEAVLAEVNAIADLYRTMGGLEEPARGRFASQICAYVHQVINKEWPSVHQGERYDATWVLFTELARGIIAFHPTTPHEDALYPQLLSDTDNMEQARRQRLFLGTQGISSVTWVIIGFGAVITLGFACFFPVSRLLAHLLMIGAMSTLFGLILSLIVSMDRPLQGHFSVESTAFKELYGHLVCEKVP